MINSWLCCKGVANVIKGLEPISKYLIQLLLRHFFLSMALSPWVPVLVLIKAPCALTGEGCMLWWRGEGFVSWICTVSCIRRLPYLKWACEHDCPLVQTSSWQFRWMNSLQSYALLLTAIKLTPSCFPNWRSEGWCWREVGGEKDESGVCEAAHVKGSLFFTSQTNHFETGG